MTQTSRRPRSDAIRNRALLIEAAKDAFRDEGLGASVNAIAERAGVNIATLYRHFPTKDHLVAAVMDAMLEPLAAARDRALASGGPVLARFLEEAVTQQAANRGLAETLHQSELAVMIKPRLRDRAFAITAPIAERAHATGELREDFGTRDLLVALGMISMLVGREEIEPARYVEMVLRGLRPEPAA